MREIFKIIRDVELYSHNVIASVLEDGVASKTLISGEEIVHCSGELEFMKAHVKDFAEVRETNIYEMDGRTVYCELLGSAPELVVCGAGHVGLACIKAAKLIEMKVTCYEDRPELAEMARQAGADVVIEGPVAENIKSLKGGKDMFIVTMMRAHALDQMNLEVLLPLESAYIGMLGSGKKVEAIKSNLDAKGFDISLFDKLNTPIGLNINAKTPEEIAIAIIGQIIQAKNAAVQQGKVMNEEILEAVIESKSPSILATLVRKKSASPRDPGTKMVIESDGSKAGTIGGGLAEAETVKLAAELMADPEFKTCVRTVGEGKIKKELSGMACSGVIDVLFEKI